MRRKEGRNKHMYNNYTCSLDIKYCVHVHFRCRRKEERSKLGQTNKQGKATQYTQGTCIYICIGGCGIHVAIVLPFVFVCSITIASVLTHASLCMYT